MDLTQRQVMSVRAGVCECEIERAKAGTTRLFSCAVASAATIWVAPM